MLSTQEIDFIRLNHKSDINKLALSKDKFPTNIRAELVIHQIATLQKIQKKLPLIANNYELFFPKSISIEQSSSEITAKYKASIVDYKHSADLTGGMGIDSIYFSQIAEQHIYNEIDSELCSIFQYNISHLGIENIRVANQSASEFITTNIDDIDFIYLDPARRNEQSGKTYFLEDTLPNPIKIVESIYYSNLEVKPKILIKTSPLLDISRAIEQLEFVSQVHIISIENECKELLFLIDFDSDSSISYFAVDFSKGIETKTSFYQQTTIYTENSFPQKFLYEPNASLMKLGFWNEIASKYSINSISGNTHLYTSDTLLNDFPGRKFEIIAIEKVDKKSILQHLPNKKANISVRNFHISVADIRKKMGIADGGEHFIFFVQLSNGDAKALICRKI